MIVVLMLSTAAGSAVVGAPCPDGTGVVACPNAVPAEGSASLGFFENAGQFPDGDVAFYSGLPYGGVAFTRDGVVMSMRDPSADGV
ncbi:MAG: hypothetical protein GWN18_15720, partial [Thermoplasmata archaeon]|nr:hypothetical protein [Thermoplasmata archaeon]NIS12057.1 hypothetical protein [Thermoplasmata archaeon]NIT78936.1 hypothetical protein [Thermoplasmata archaeon]NIU50440.1 hypothetical protein [Thermoplasmata archaeon]NIW83969.1 hypothetical protein [Thermoplasmata archaeon]